MVRRSLGVALWMIVGLLACFLGALSALVGTGAGRGLLARVTESALTQVFTGSIEVGDVRGSLLTGVTLTGVRLFDADTTLVALLPRADLAYNPLDFAAGRVVLFEFALRQPVINIVQHKNGRLNIEELLRLGGPDTGSGPHGPATLILFRNVRIEDGTVTLRLQAAHAEPGDTALEIQGRGPNGRQRIRRFEHLDAPLAALHVSSPGGRVLEVGLNPLRLSQGGGTVTGHLTVLSAADSGLVALRDAELDAQDFDLEFARPFLDTLPFAGWLTGHTTATGPVSGLTLDVDWTFRDSLVPGRPETRIRGRGEVALGAGAGGDLRFQPFTVKAVVDLGTGERPVTAAALHGLLYADGTLHGPWRDVQCTGTLEHRDGGRPPTRLTGTVRLDGRSDTLGVYADLTADSLSFDGLKGSFPALPLRGAVAGRVQLTGPLAALETHAALHSAG